MGLGSYVMLFLKIIVTIGCYYNNIIINARCCNKTKGNARCCNKIKGNRSVQ